jgi:mevalonate kinase
MVENITYYGHGKLLLTGEYFVLDGAMSLALPTTVGQSFKVKYKKSYTPRLNWKSFDATGKEWFSAQFEFWRFNETNGNEKDEKVKILQSYLKEARKQNPHFLRDDVAIDVETKLEFPLEWGLGSSSSLIYNIAQWAYVSPFELQAQTSGGSGYDIACAQSDGPILYSRDENAPSWKTVEFEPEFKENLYFIYLGKKQSTKEGIELYKQRGNPSPKIINKITRITKSMLHVESLSEFEDLIAEHEDIVSDHLKLKKVKTKHFEDYWGQVKSLGAWGGDFALVTSSKSFHETRKYFVDKGFTSFIQYDEIVRNRNGHN